MAVPLPAGASSTDAFGLFPLSWSHFVRLISVPNRQTRSFHQSEAMKGGWFGIGDEWYRIDLRLFRRRLSCLVATDLTIGRFTDADAANAKVTPGVQRQSG